MSIFAGVKRRSKLPAPKWEKRTVVSRGTEDWQPTETQHDAEVYGPFAVYQDDEGGRCRKQWRILHVEAGLHLGMPFRTSKQAKRATEKLESTIRGRDCSVATFDEWAVQGKPFRDLADAMRLSAKITGCKGFADPDVTAADLPRLKAQYEAQMEPYDALNRRNRYMMASESEREAMRREDPEYESE